MRVDYIRVPGRERVPDPRNRCEAVEILDPLLRAIPRAIAQVMDDLPKAFHLPEGASRREDVPLLPYEAVREVVVNAVMHRNYRVRGPMQILRYANRLEVRKPGFSLVPDERLGEPGSITRNEKIAAILHETRYAETKGTGIRAVRELMQRYDLAPPFFESDREKDSFTVYLLFHHLLASEDLEWLDRFREPELTPEEQKALVYVREIGAVDNRLYRTINGVETLVASAHLRRLRDLGLLAAKGRGRATYYVPSPRLLQEWPDGAAEKSDELPEKSDQLEAKSAMLTQLPDDLCQAISRLGRRVPQDQVRGLIFQLCKIRSMRLEELACLLDRQPRSLRNHHLRPMVKEGLLEYVYPDYPTHPLQAYRTVQGPGQA